MGTEKADGKIRNDQRCRKRMKRAWCPKCQGGKHFKKAWLIKSTFQRTRGGERVQWNGQSEKSWSRLELFQQSNESESQWQQSEEQKRNKVVPSDRCQVRIYVVFLRGETELVWGQPWVYAFLWQFLATHKWGGTGKADGRPGWMGRKTKRETKLRETVDK